MMIVLDHVAHNLLFGRDGQDLPALSGDDLVSWVFLHPLNHDRCVAQYRLTKVLDEDDLALLRAIIGAEFGVLGRSLHSALANYAELRFHLDGAEAFLGSFEAPLTIEGPGGLWDVMSAEGGSIRCITRFEHLPSGRLLPLRVDFHRAITSDHVRNELAEFSLSKNGAACRLQHGLSHILTHRFFAIYPFLFRYFRDCELWGEFALSLGDEGLPERVLSFSSIVPDFLVPDVGYVSSLGYQRERDLYGAAIPWNQREDRAYWRGTDTGAFRYRILTDAPRVRMVQLSIEHPDLLDARLTQVELRPGWDVKQRFYEGAGLMGPPEDQLRILDFKYQIDVDGNTNAWSGFYLKLLTGAPVLKVESELGFRQWYYHKLQPWKNYVPVRADLNDLIEKLRWLREHPHDAERIGRNGRDLALSLGFEDSIAEAAAVVEKIVSINRRVLS